MYSFSICTTSYHKPIGLQQYLFIIWFFFLGQNSGHNKTGFSAWVSQAEVKASAGPVISFEALYPLLNSLLIDRTQLPRDVGLRSLPSCWLSTKDCQLKTVSRNMVLSTIWQFAPSRPIWESHLFWICLASFKGSSN